MPIIQEITGNVYGDLTVLCTSGQRAANGAVLWRCRCACGGECLATAAQLKTGKKSHCGCKTQRNYYHRDIAGRVFGDLKALFPLEKRDPRGYLIWRCRCTCGNSIDVDYNNLVSGQRISCGCRKKAHDQAFPSLVARADGTSIDHLKSKKLPASNTTGVKGVYLIRGKYVAKIVFQQKQYHLGTFSRIEDAIEARREGEDIFIASTLRHYTAWQKKAGMDAAWAEENPIRIQVEKQGGSYFLRFFPELSF